MAPEKRVKREGGREKERGKKDCAKRAEQREAEEGTVNLLCISSTGSYEDKLQREVPGPY